jgi:hypothetical protein
VALLVMMALGIVLAGSAAAQAPAPRLGHFKCYIATGEPVNETVGTQDQFDIADQTGFEPTDVRQAVRLCNPVEKIHKRRVFPIPDRRAHLTLYLAPTHNIEPTRRVVVDNQFGKARLLTFNPLVLAAPTQKNNEGFPEDLDHYKCYRAYGASAKAVVTLRDQFSVEERVEVGRPLLFCNPTRKIHAAGAVFGVNNATDHLVCYQTERRPFERSVTTLDQFGTHQLRLREADLLCAPTEKLDFERLQ